MGHSRIVLTLKKIVANEFKPVESVESVAEKAAETNSPVKPGECLKIFVARYGKS